MNQVERVFARVVGRPCWGVRRGHGSFITLEFGRPRLHVREPIQAQMVTSLRVQRNLARRIVHIHGQWHLWIYGCEWSLRVKGRVVGDWTTKRRIDRAVHALDGQRLLAVKVSARGARTSFIFDLGAELDTKPYDRSGEQWLLFEPNHRVFTWRADRKYQHKASNRPASRHGWRKLPSG
jgi:hypothetical protein